ncbi:uncharacterized protein LOC135163516 [Diachasmimorpha longicaudata]|uniref:uncharacterized protein LOC135163516 n=1 Tax=Diachasmimorpha longicaudata TaxID=58733 RepID=UPI0030B8E202
MPNVGGPKQRSRALLASVATSVMTYAIPIWAKALQVKETRRKLAAGHRLRALRVASAFRTVSESTIEVIAGKMPIEIIAQERVELYRRKNAGVAEATLGPTDATREGAPEADEVRAESFANWQVLWQHGEVNPKKNPPATPAGATPGGAGGRYISFPS